MKKYFSIFSLALMIVCCNVVFSSCGDDDDDVVVEKHNDLIGTWERVDRVKRDIWVFYADGKYLRMYQDLWKSPSVKYYDENLTYYQTKGYYSATNGTLSLEQTHVWYNVWNNREVMDWEESSEIITFPYIVDGNTFKFNYDYPHLGMIVPVTYTRVK